MPHRKKVLRSASCYTPNGSNVSRPRRRLWLYVACIGLAAVSLACSGFGVSSGSRIVRIHLPTLTRTPLPTLTPTTNAAQLAAVPATEDVAPSPSSNDVAAPVSESLVNPPAPPPAPAQVAAPQTAADPNLSPAPAAPPAVADTSTNAAPAAPLSPDAGTAVVQVSIPTPTATPPPLPTDIATPPPPTNTPLPTETPTVTPTPTETPLPQGWVFSGVQAYPADALHGFAFYGELFNNTGGPQQLSKINASFFDAQGQPIAFERAINQWPVRTVPHGGRVPFGVIVPDIQGIADYDFQVEAEPGGQMPRADFEFVDINPATVEEKYCLTGRLVNPGDRLNAYLMVAAVLYDAQDQVINYNNAFQVSPTNIVGDQTGEVNLCIDPRRQEVARYDLQAWGL